MLSNVTNSTLISFVDATFLFPTTGARPSRTEKCPQDIVQHVRDDIAFSKQWFNVWLMAGSAWGTVPAIVIINYEY